MAVLGKRTETYAGRVACYHPCDSLIVRLTRAALTLDERRDRQTDGMDRHQTDALRYAYRYSRSRRNNQLYIVYPILHKEKQKSMGETMGKGLELNLSLLASRANRGIDTKTMNYWLDC